MHTEWHPSTEDSQEEREVITEQESHSVWETGNGFVNNKVVHGCFSILLQLSIYNAMLKKKKKC